MKNQYLKAIFIGLLTVILLGSAAAVQAATWTVTKSTNGNDGTCDSDCSLREAVATADSGDTIVFNANLIGQTFTLGGEDIDVTKRITIDGNIDGVNTAFISGSNTSRHFYVEDNASLTLRNITLVQGNGKSFAAQVGTTDGGAIYVRPSASLLLDRVSIRGNSAYFGGAISLGSGTHHFINSSITSNSGSAASAIFNNGGTLYIANVTISGNFTPDLLSSGHAIWNQQSTGFAYIRNSTIARNSAAMDGGEGGGIFNRLNGTLNIGNTIVAQNTDENGTDIRNDGATIVSVGGNLIGDLGSIPAGTFNQPNDIFGVNPLLGPTNASLDGFPVVTHPLQAGSLARNGGLNAVAVDPLTNLPLAFDARCTGFPRITDTTVDIGAFEDQSGNTSLIVSKNANSNDLVCDTDCSLREAVHQASLNFGTDTITFANNVFGTIPLGGSEILIQNQNVNIDGSTTANSNYRIISGENTSRVFRLNNATVNITGMTFANGNAGAGFGGAILADNNSNLTLDKVIVRNNFATAYGAAHLSGGTHRIINSTINNNSANTGLALSISGTLNMANTTVSGNLDADGGTGIGAIFVTGTANIRNSTIAFNRTSGGTGGGIFSAGTLNIGNTIVSNNLAATSPDIHLSSGTITSVGGNLVLNTSGFPAGTFNQPNDTTGVDPMLAVLADNGGSVTTHSLPPLSPSVNTGVNANAIDPADSSILQFDARGNVNRISDGTVDKGAFESVGPSSASVTVSGRVTTADGRGITRAFVVITDSNGTTRSAMTGSFGYFSFSEVEAGQTYVASVLSKRFSFSSQIVVIIDDVTDLNFIAEDFDSGLKK